MKLHLSSKTKSNFSQQVTGHILHTKHVSMRKSQCKQTFLHWSASSVDWPLLPSTRKQSMSFVEWSKPETSCNCVDILTRFLLAASNNNRTAKFRWVHLLRITVSAQFIKLIKFYNSPYINLTSTCELWVLFCCYFLNVFSVLKVVIWAGAQSKALYGHTCFLAVKVRICS